MTYLKGIIKGKTKKIVKETSIEENKLYYAEDFPDNTIRSNLMSSILKDKKLASLVKEGNSYICLDDGDYIKNHTYKFTGDSWEDITVEYKDIEHLIGTLKNPINLAKDLEVGKLYRCSGYLQDNYLNHSTNLGNYSIYLIHKISTSRVYIFNCSASVSNNNFSISLQNGNVAIVDFNSSTGVISSASSNLTLSSVNGTLNSTSIYAPTNYGSSGQILQSQGQNKAPTWVYFWINGTSNTNDRRIYAPIEGGTLGQLLKSNGNSAPTWIDNPIKKNGSGDKYLSDTGEYKKIIIPEIKLDDITISKNKENELQATGLIYNTTEVISGDTIDTGLTISRYDDRASYSITNNLTNCTTTNKTTYAGQGDPYFANIYADTNYILDEKSTISIIMGDTDITSTSYSNGTINIEHVTDNLTITIVASEILPIVYTEPQKDVAYTPLDNLFNFSYYKINAYSKAISNNENILPTTTDLYIHDGVDRYHIHLGTEIKFTFKETEEQVIMQIVSFNHYDLVDKTIYGGDEENVTGKSGMVLFSKDCLSTSYKMEDTQTNSGGWESTRIRTTTVPALLELLPDDLKSIVKKVKILTSKGSQSSNITETEDTIFIPSQIELYGNTSYSFEGEGTRYGYYEGKTNQDLIKNKDTSTPSYWTRSPYKSSSQGFVLVQGGNGYATYTTSPNYVQATAIAFCI